MKAISGPLNSSQLLCSVLLLSFFLASYFSNAQEQDHYQSIPISGKGYWKLRTDYLSRRTVVWFYNTEHELMYKEELPQKYLKATPRNIRSLNLILANLTDKKLVASEIKASQLMTDTREITSINEAEEKSSEAVPVRPVSSGNTSILRAVVHSIPDRMAIKMFIQNPSQKNVYFRLTDDNSTPLYNLPSYLYKESSTVADYSRTLDLSMFKPGKYKLEVSAQNYQQKFVVYISEEISGKKIKVMPY